MVMSYKLIVYAVAENVAVIKISRGKANATVPEMYVELAHAFLTAAADPAVVFTYLTGEGRFFSAGADVDGGLDDAMRCDFAGGMPSLNGRSFTL